MPARPWPGSACPTRKSVGTCADSSIGCSAFALPRCRPRLSADRKIMVPRGQPTRPTFRSSQLLHWVLTPAGLHSQKNCKRDRNGQAQCCGHHDIPVRQGQGQIKLDYPSRRSQFAQKKAACPACSDSHRKACGNQQVDPQPGNRGALGPSRQRPTGLCRCDEDPNGHRLQQHQQHPVEHGCFRGTCGHERQQGG